MEVVSYGSIQIVLIPVKFALMAGLTFLAAARDGEHVAVLEHERRSDGGISVPLFTAVHHTLDRVGVFHLVRPTSFDAVRLFRSFPISTLIDLPQTEWKWSFLNFIFETRRYRITLPRPSGPRMRLVHIALGKPVCLSHASRYQLRLCP